MTKAERHLLLLVAELLLDWLRRKERIIETLDLAKALSEVTKEATP